MSRPLVLRAIVANLDCELHWARASGTGPHKELPSAVRKAISEFSQAFQIFATPGDAFFTLDDLSGDNPPNLAEFSRLLPWGQTAALPSLPAPINDDASWPERLWQLHCAPSVAAKCNDRRFCLPLDLPKDAQLGGVEVVSSLADLDHYIATQPLGPDDSWVAKAPWGASGRERLKRRGRVLDGEQRVRAERLLCRYEELVVEPWMNRCADFAVAGIVGETLASSVVFPPHQLHCDAGGVFRGIHIDDEGTRHKLGEHEGLLVMCAQQVRASLARHGYRGPFGVDAFVYLQGGQPRLCAVCEVNARMSFGLIARARVETSGQRTGSLSVARSVTLSQT